MNIYADRGNLQLLQRRCEWRGIGFSLGGAGLGDPLDPDAHDLFYIGGGQDRDQALCAEDLATVKRDALHAPLLPKNAWFADGLTATALGRHPGELAPLEDALEDAAHAAARRAAGL